MTLSHGIGHWKHGADKQRSFQGAMSFGSDVLTAHLECVR